MIFTILATISGIVGLATASVGLVTAIVALFIKLRELRAKH